METTISPGTDAVLQRMLGASLSAAQLDTVVDAGEELVAFTAFEIDDDLAADFAALGINLDAAATLEAEKRAAAAAMLLRRAGQCRADEARLRETMRLEVQLISAHYDRLMTRERQTAEQCERAVEALAQIAKDAGDFGRKQSHDTPFGTFGYRNRGASVAVVDERALIDYARQVVPQFVEAKVTLPYGEALEFFTPTELDTIGACKVRWGELKKTLDPAQPEALPPGVTATPATVEYYAKPVIGRVAP